MATTFLRLVAKRRPEDFFNFEPWGCLIPLRGEENEDNLFKWRHNIDVFVSEASGLDRTSQTDLKLHQLEMLTLHLPKCLLEYPKEVYWDLYCF